MTDPIITDPYRSLDEDLRGKITADVHIEDLRLIKSVYPIRGVFQAILGQYIHSITTEMRKNGLTTYSPENCSAFLNIVHRHAHPDSAPANHGHNVSPGTPIIPGSNTNPPDVSTDAQSKSSSGGRTVNTKKKIFKAKV